MRGNRFGGDWAELGAGVGAMIPIDSGFRQPVNRDDTWRLTGFTTVEETPEGVSTLTISGPASRATYRLPGGPGLYLVETQVRTAGPAVGRVTIKCVSAGEEDLVKRTAMSAAGGTAEDWQHIGVVILSPKGTESLAIVLDRRGDDVVGFQDVTLRGSSTRYPTAPPIGGAEAEDKDEATDEEVSDG